MHYHILWSGGKYDWQGFATEHDAEKLAEEIVLPGEFFTIEKFDSECRVCKANRYVRRQHSVGGPRDQ
jgi:hypothetical protein